MALGFELTCLAPNPWMVPLTLLPLLCVKKGQEDFPGGAVVENLPANAGDMGLSPGP